MIDDQVNQHPHAALLAAMCELNEITERPIAWVYAVIIGHVVTIVPPRRRLERHQPYGSDTQALKVIEAPN